MNIEKIILDQISEYKAHYALIAGAENPAHKINCGFCFHFAMRLSTKIPDLMIVDTTLYDSHTFVKVGDRYYDSECPKGVKDWTFMPFCQKNFIGEVVAYFPKDAFKYSKLPQASWRIYQAYGKKKPINGNFFDNDWKKKKWSRVASPKSLKALCE